MYVKRSSFTFEKDIMDFVKEFTEIISSTGKFESKAMMVAIQNISFFYLDKLIKKQDFNKFEVLNYVTNKLGFEPNRDLIELFLLKGMKITEINEKTIGYFSCFKHIYIGFNEKQCIYYYSKYHDLHSPLSRLIYPGLINALIKESTDIEIEKFGLSSFFGNPCRHEVDEVARLMSERYINFLSNELSEIGKKVEHLIGKQSWISDLNREFLKVK